MEKKYSYLIKNTGILTISNFSSKVLTFLLVPLYTSVLSTEQYGIYDLIITTINFIFPIITLNIVDAVMRFAMEKNCSKSDVATVGIRYIILSGILVCISVIICSNIFKSKILNGFELYIISYYFAYAIYQYLVQFSKGIEEVKLMACAGVISTTIMLLGNILFLIVFKWSLKGFFLANILSFFIADLYLFFRINLPEYINHVAFNKELNKEMLQYSIPLIFTSIGWWINSASDKYVVTIICGVAANGLLSVAYKIPALVNTMFGMFGQAWQISVIKEYGEEKSGQFYSESFNVINFFMCISCAIVIFLSKPIAKILYANEFYAAWQYAPFLLLSSVFNTASGMIGPIFSATKESRKLASSTIYGAIVNTFLNFVLVSMLDIQGATIATAISSFFIYKIRRYYIKKSKVELDINFYIFVIWVLLIIEAIIEVYTDFWYAEILIILLIAVLSGKEIKKITHIIYGLIKR